MDAIILAGGRLSRESPLFKLSGDGIKELIEIAGKPMIQWVIDALDQSEQIDRIFICGLPHNNQLISTRKIFYLQGGKTLMESILVGMDQLIKLDPTVQKCLVVSGDIPAISRDMIDWVINSASDPEIEIFYNVIPKSVMEEKFPGSKRSYVKLKDMTVCGGDMHIFNPRSTVRDGSKWRTIVESRKSTRKLMFLFGIEILFRVLFKTPTLQEISNLVCNRLEMKGKAVVSPYAELGMDVDKLNQFRILESVLKVRHLT